MDENTIEAKALQMIIKVKKLGINVAGFVFVCHPSFAFSKNSEFMGHKVKTDTSCPKDMLYFMKDPKPENYILLDDQWEEKI